MRERATGYTQLNLTLHGPPARRHPRLTALDLAHRASNESARGVDRGLSTVVAASNLGAWARFLVDMAETTGRRVSRRVDSWQASRRRCCNSLTGMAAAHSACRRDRTPLGPSSVVGNEMCRLSRMGQVLWRSIGLRGTGWALVSSERWRYGARLTLLWFMFFFRGEKSVSFNNWHNFSVILYLAAWSRSGCA